MADAPARTPIWPAGRYTGAITYVSRIITVRLIQNAQEYREARQMLLDLVGLDPALGTPADDQLFALASGVERYEMEHVLDLPAGARRTMVAKHGWSADTFGSRQFLQPEWERRRLRFALGLRTPLTQDDRQVLRRVVPVSEDAGEPFAVRIADVPEPMQQELREWWRMWCLPLFNPDGCGDCIYAWDWADWLDGRIPDLP